MTLAVRAEYSSAFSEHSSSRSLRQCFAPLKSAQRRHFRGPEIDELSRRHFVTVHLQHAPAPSPDEQSFLTRSLAYNSKSLKFDRMRGSLASHPTLQLFTRYDAVDGFLWGKFVADVDESLELVLSWVWLWCAYERMDVHTASNGTLRRQTDYNPTRPSVSQVVRQENKLAPGISNRRGAVRYSWFRCAPGFSDLGDAYVIAFEPDVEASTDPAGQHEGLNENRFTANSIVISTWGLVTFERLAPRVTRVCMVQKVILGGDIPQLIVNKLVKTSFTMLENLQKKYKRSNFDVDGVSPRFPPASCCRYPSYVEALWPDESLAIFSALSLALTTFESRALLLALLCLLPSLAPTIIRY